MIENIDYRLENIAGGFPRNSEMFTVYIDEKECGSLIYYWAEASQRWVIEGVDVPEEAQGKGIGGKLVDAFARRIGSNQQIYCAVSHEDSVNMLAEKYKNARVQGFYFLPEDEIPEVPIVGLLNKGNIITERIRVSPNLLDPDESPYDFELWARTAGYPQS